MAIDFELSETQVALQTAAREFAKNEIEPVAAEIDRDQEHRFHWGIIKKLAANDFLSMSVPTQYGGSGLDRRSMAIVIEELAVACGGIAASVTAHTVHGAVIIADWGNEEQKQKFLPPVCDTHNPVLVGFAATEPDAGSDIVSMKTTARVDGDSYVIDGTKHFISHAGVAGVYLVFAVTDKSKAHRGISGFIVPADVKGLSFGKIEDKMGQRFFPTGEMIFDAVKVPRENLLVEEGRGFYIMMDTLNKGRAVATGATSLGVARSAYEIALNYAKQRVQFGKPIFQQEAISFMLADMLTQIEAARLLVWRACWLIDQGLPHIKQGAMAKVFASDMAMKVTTDAVQIMGGYGYMRDFPLEKRMRDAKLLQIYEGTNQIQRLIISRQL